MEYSEQCTFEKHAPGYPGQQLLSHTPHLPPPQWAKKDSFYHHGSPREPSSTLLSSTDRQQTLFRDQIKGAVLNSKSFTLEFRVILAGKTIKF